MKFNLIQPSFQYKVYSIAISERAEIELQEQKLPYWIVRNGKIINSVTKKEIKIRNPENISLEELNDFDVIEELPNGMVNRYYDDSSEDNLFFITEKCNSNCIMCPSPEISRKKGGSWGAEQLIYIAKYIPTDAKHFTITGGEPFMIGIQIFDFFKYLREKFQETEFLILTNGRALAIDSYYRELKTSLPYNVLFGIPLHGSNADLHDFITRSKGSFIQAVVGIKNLLSLNIPVEIRIVVTKQNIRDLENLAEFIAYEFPNIDHVSIMAMEMTGNAYVNRQQVWIPYRESFAFVRNAINTLIKNAIDVRLYNYPLCTVQPEYWTLCRKSIAARKIRYQPICEFCKVKDACGGIFSGTKRFEENEIRAIL